MSMLSLPGAVYGPHLWQPLETGLRDEAYRQDSEFSDQIGAARGAVHGMIAALALWALFGLLFF